MLEKAIEKKRRKMMYLAKVHGISSPKTLKCSQELDLLLNIQQSITPESAPFGDCKSTL